jgi:phosphatidylglycerol:prolipoprotein diacylglycerol transferase
LPSVTLSSPGAVAFKIGPLAIRWYALFITFGFLVATWAATLIARRRNISADNFLDCAMLVFLGGIVGARLYFAALSWQTFENPLEIFQIWRGGLSIHGGIIGGALTGYIYCRVSKMSFLNGADIFGAAVPLAQAIGRWGNFFNSEAFGGPVSESFPIKLFIPEAARPEALREYQYFQPTFLYESLWDLAIFFILYFVLFDKFKKYPGMTFLAYILLYSIGRAIIEPLRTDSIMVGSMAAPLAVSAGLIAAAAIGMLLLWRYYESKKNNSPEEKGLNQNQGE